MKLLLIFIFLFSARVEAAKKGSWYLGTGVLNHNLVKASGDSSGQTSFLGNNYYLPLQIKTYIGMNPKWQTMLKAMYTVIPRTTLDGGAQTTMLLLAAPLVYNFSEHWEFDFGLSWFLYMVKGKGGVTSQPNGSSTSIYGLPARFEMTKNLIFEAGVSYSKDYYNIGLDVLLISPLTSRRAFSLLLTYNYKFAGR